MMKRILLTTIFILLAQISYAANSKVLNIIASTETLASLVKEIGGEAVKVESFSRGTEDPHYIEAKPSFMVKARDADLIVVVGLDLESAWVTNVVKGSRNPQIMPGGKGYLELGTFVETLEKIGGAVDRSQGDVHPLGNPHFYLDPIRIKDVMPKISQKLAELSPENKIMFETNTKNFQNLLQSKTAEWDKRIQKTNIKQLITYHKTFAYFLSRFNISLASTVEPKPGLPPTASHIIQLIKTAKESNIRCVLNENHFETVAAQRIAKEHPMKVMAVPTEVGGSAKAKNYISLIEEIVSAVESCGEFQKQIIESKKSKATQ